MLCLFVGPVGLDNGVGLRPAMGYNTWNDLRCEGVTADAIDAIAVAMVELGLAKLGYAYLNVDDCWATATDPSGELVADPAAFPDGLPALVESVHARGLRFGLYGDRGWKTCAFRPGSGGLEPAHAAQFARWGVDYLKYDSCWASNDHDAAFKQYGAMRDALNASGRPVLYSLCGWNAWYAPRGAELANSWRIAADCDEWANVYVAVRTNEALLSGLADTSKTTSRLFLDTSSSSTRRSSSASFPTPRVTSPNSPPPPRFSPASRGPLTLRASPGPQRRSASTRRRAASTTLTCSSAQTRPRRRT